MPRQHCSLTCISVRWRSNCHQFWKRIHIHTPRTFATRPQIGRAIRSILSNRPLTGAQPFSSLQRGRNCTKTVIIHTENGYVPSTYLHVSPTKSLQHRAEGLCNRPAYGDTQIDCSEDCSECLLLPGIRTLHGKACAQTLQKWVRSEGSFGPSWSKTHALLRVLASFNNKLLISIHIESKVHAQSTQQETCV